VAEEPERYFLAGEDPYGRADLGFDPELAL